MLAFARYTLMETALVATNLSDKEQKFYIDMAKLKQILGSTLGVNTVIMTSDLLDASSDQGSTDYYFLQEFLTIKHWQTLQPFTSSATLITVC